MITKLLRIQNGKNAITIIKIIFLRKKPTGPQLMYGLNYDIQTNRIWIQTHRQVPHVILLFQYIHVTLLAMICFDKNKAIGI